MMTSSGNFLFTVGITLLLRCCAGDVIADVIVNTRYGRLRGRRVQKDYGLGQDAVTTVFDRYFGIPYAKPPTGQLRFTAPQRLQPWGDDVTRDALQFGPSCPQMIFESDDRLKPHDEDCLYLNIYSPYQESKPGERYPVMLFVHGGSYEVGAGRMVDGSVLAQFGVVVVTFNYRLGALGFLLSGDDQLRGNYGLLDQAAAVRWVHDNIAPFRGDPGRVTLFGHSVGAASVGLLMIMPQTAGLFHGVIAQSGVATAPYSVYSADDGIDFGQYVRDVGHLFSCRGARGAAQLQDVIACLRRVPQRDIIAKRGSFPLYHPINPEFRPNVDGHVILDKPKNLFARGDFARVPFIIGTVRDEFGNYFNGRERYRREFDEALDSYLKRLLHGQTALFDLVKFHYTDWTNRSSLYEYQRGDVLSDMHMIAPTDEMADLIAARSADIYEYHFSTPGASFHSVELNYVFGAPFSGRFADEMTVNGSVSQFSESQRRLCRHVLRLWTDFARHGRPTSGSDVSEVTWSRYTRADRRYLRLSADGSRMESHLRAGHVAFWNRLIPTMLGRRREDWMAAGGRQRSSGALTVGLWSLAVACVLLVAVIAVLGAVQVRHSMLARRRRGAAAATAAAAGCKVAV